MHKILIVDDEPDVVKSFKKTLGREGYEVTGAGSGEECMEKLEKESVDLVLMDFFMHGMDGRMVVEKIRESPGLKNTKVAFLTSASFGERGIEILNELGVMDYITKPIEVNDFRTRIKKIIQK